MGLFRTPMIQVEDGPDTYWTAMFTILAEIEDVVPLLTEAEVGPLVARPPANNRA